MHICLVNFYFKRGPHALHWPLKLNKLLRDFYQNFIRTATIPLFIEILTTNLAIY